MVTGEFTFSVNDISNIKVYGMQGVYETPLPAAACMFLTGLAGLGWIKKRKQNRALTAQFA